jgi:hypothetical protein
MMALVELVAQASLLMAAGISILFGVSDASFTEDQGQSLELKLTA